MMMMMMMMVLSLEKPMALLKGHYDDYDYDDEVALMASMVKSAIFGDGWLVVYALTNGDL